MAWHLSLVHVSGPLARMGALPAVGFAPKTARLTDSTIGSPGR